jgi:enamine deaminase RidA (YjgF/YER057c/UK114 family)
MTIARWPASAPGRSRTVAGQGLVWTVANPSDRTLDFDGQVHESLTKLDQHLREAGSDRHQILSLQVLLTKIENRDRFDEHWRRWIGSDPQHWPQRACFQVQLAPGLEVELIAVAVLVEESQTVPDPVRGAERDGYRHEPSRPGKGRPVDPEEISMDKQVIEKYVACGPRLRQAVAGLSPDDLTARPGPGDWSILEVVIHLVDSDAIAIDRMKRMLTEDNPPLLYADETAYVRCLATHEQSLEDALTLLEVGRRQFARVLHALPDEAFARRGTHNRRGVVTVGDMVNSYIQHVDHHLTFLMEKRARLGKPLRATAESR